MSAAQQFGNRLRTLRKLQKLKIGQLAEKADTGIKHLGRIERGEKQPSFELIIALAQALSISPSTLFEFDSPRADLKAIKKQLDQFFAKQDVKDVARLTRVLAALLHP